jgi:hypothetical protein
MPGSALHPGLPLLYAREYAECASTLAALGCRTRCHGVAFGRQKGDERAGQRLGAAATQFGAPIPNFVERWVDDELEGEWGRDAANHRRGHASTRPTRRRWSI